MLVVCALAAVALAIAITWPITDLIAAHDVGMGAGPSHALHLQTAREAVRTQLLTLGAGVFAAGALVYTARNFRLSRRQFELAQQGMALAEQGQRRTLELTEQGQVTDRYTRAIEQLGSEKLDVRIGGISALKRIASDSARDHPTVMEVLAAFVREHSHERWPVQATGVPASEPTLRPDVLAAILVIRRRDDERDREPIDLSAADLHGADLHGADLRGAYLNGAHLNGADLHGARLK
jgi:hypothetical protein